MRKISLDKDDDISLYRKLLLFMSGEMPNTASIAGKRSDWSIRSDLKAAGYADKAISKETKAMILAHTDTALMTVIIP